MLRDVRESLGVQTKSGSAEPGARNAPAHGFAVLGVDAGGGRPSHHGGPGYNARKIFEIVNARR
jgi:hypothetical protein